MYCKAWRPSSESTGKQIELRAEAKELRIMSAQHTPAKPPNPEQIFSTVQRYQRAFALKAAVDIDLFTAIAKGNNRAADIARATKAAERGVRILCDAMTVMGMLTKSGNRYSLTGDSAFFLDSQSPAYLGRAFKF